MHLCVGWYEHDQSEFVVVLQDSCVQAGLKTQFLSA